MKENMKIKQALKQFGITPNLKGYHYVVEGVRLLKEDFEKNGTPRKFMKLYKDVAELFDEKPYNVERCIRNVVQISENNMTEFFVSIFGCVKKMKSAVFMSVLSEYVLYNY